jgi:hypothetical protein
VRHGTVHDMKHASKGNDPWGLAAATHCAPGSFAAQPAGISIEHEPLELMDATDNESAPERCVDAGESKGRMHAHARHPIEKLQANACMTDHAIAGAPDRDMIFPLDARNARARDWSVRDILRW